ncbi:MAG: ABC transporter ATP-binding protein [Dethiobacteria bacterium]
MLKGSRVEQGRDIDRIEMNWPIYRLERSKDVHAKALEIENLTKVFTRRGRPPVTAVDNLNLVLKTGEVVGLLGPNGAGKTTIIKCVLGLVRPTDGKITVCGWDARRQHSKAIEHTSAVLEGARNIYWRMTPRENVRFFAGLQGHDYRAARGYLEELMERFSLADKADEPVLNLSTGMKQKVAVICALARQTSLVFLDEPTLGLDLETSLELRKILRDLARNDRRTIVVSSHDMDVIQDVCKRVVIIKEGRIVADDMVENLLAIFRTRAYRMVLSDGLSPAIREELERSVENFAFTYRGKHAETTFTLPSSEKLYHVIDLVRRGGALIESISQDEPDLEEAFLRIIREEAGALERPFLANSKAD